MVFGVARTLLPFPYLMRTVGSPYLAANVESMYPIVPYCVIDVKSVPPVRTRLLRAWGPLTRLRGFGALPSDGMTSVGPVNGLYGFAPLPAASHVFCAFAQIHLVTFNVSSHASPRPIATTV